MSLIVSVSWSPSASPGVQVQSLVVSVNGVAQPAQSLPPAQSSFSLPANPGDVIAVSLTASEGGLVSPPLAGNYTVPSVPLPPTNLQFSVAAA